jgi:hypothetical protein
MKFMDPLVITGERCKWVCGRCGCMRVKYPEGQSCSSYECENVVEDVDESRWGGVARDRTGGCLESGE